MRRLKLLLPLVSKLNILSNFPLSDMQELPMARMYKKYGYVRWPGARNGASTIMIPTAPMEPSLATLLVLPRHYRAGLLPRTAQHLRTPVCGNYAAAMPSIHNNISVGARRLDHTDPRHFLVPGFFALLFASYTCDVRRHS